MVIWMSNQQNIASKNDSESSKTQSQSIPQQHAKHLIFGAGLIGCYLGACFIKAKQNVTLVLRERFRNQLNENYSISDYQNHSYKVPTLPALCDPKELNEQELKADFLWLTVKCIALEDAIVDIQPLINEKTIILCCQNGVKNHLIVQQAFPHNKVIRVMVPFNVVNDEAGHFHRGSQGHMAIESTPALIDTVKWLAGQLSSQLLPVDISYDMTALQWAKLQLNLGNAVNALADIPVKDMLETSAYRLLLAQLMDELLVIIRKKQIKLPKIASLPNKYIPTVLRLPNWAFKLVAQKMLAVDPQVRTSMWWDLNAHRQTEIEYLNNTVVEQAKRLGIKTPFNTFIVNSVKQAEAGKRISAETFYAQVKKLLI